MAAMAHARTHLYTSRNISALECCEATSVRRKARGSKSVARRHGVAGGITSSRGHHCRLSGGTSNEEEEAHLGASAGTSAHNKTYQSAADKWRISFSDMASAAPRSGTKEDRRSISAESARKRGAPWHHLRATHLQITYRSMAWQQPHSKASRSAATPAASAAAWRKAIA